MKIGNDFWEAMNVSAKKNTSEGEKLFKLKYTVGTRTSVCKLAMNKFRLKIRRIALALRGVNFWNSFPVEIRETECSTLFQHGREQFICYCCLK